MRLSHGADDGAGLLDDLGKGFVGVDQLAFLQSRIDQHLPKISVKRSLRGRRIHMLIAQAIAHAANRFKGAALGGVADLRDASTWFSIPYGEVQGDIVTVPRAVVIDFKTFEREVLPVLRAWAKEGGLPPFDPGADELPSASLESHVAIGHAAYPPDPGQAAIRSGQLQRVLGRAAGSTSVIVADNAEEVLAESQVDAVNAKIMFPLLGIPGVLVAAALGLTGASTLIEARRREEALLRMRGATDGQIAQLATAHAIAAGLAGSALGLLIAAIGVNIVTGRPVWQGVPATGLLVSAGLAVAAAALSSGSRIVRLRRASGRSDIFERRLLDHGWSPIWQRACLDVIAIAVGLAVLAIDVLAGGLRRSPVEAPADPDRPGHRGHRRRARQSGDRHSRRARPRHPGRPGSRAVLRAGAAAQRTPGRTDGARPVHGDGIDGRPGGRPQRAEPHPS